ncbi:hypothetical protein M0G43_10000 [Subsaxibacter sp. CAU 1640]|uniref:hypothetical protein n=1 Tax=Subsaxibacter sp. CAU 1640 TaxID=2933271 RepID=UPI002004C476|nr:hypothetical protein [Subsaxibacter sp. CAU 1640]MCK7590903.1 hypothetical protein [Subsaxibacter sp. CAU 1640]
MKFVLTALCLFSLQIGYSQQYDSVITENENVDLNNDIYKPGNVFIYDYEIIYGGKKHKLKKNGSKFDESKQERVIDFEFASSDFDSLAVEKIHLLVKPVADADRTNENQTQISYLQGPVFSSLSSTGAVENNDNVWIHPIRDGFFSALETAPFPFIKKPIKIGMEWNDQMSIGDGWGNELWGAWEGELLLTYNYKIIRKETIATQIGEMDCFVIVSTATSDIGTSKLTSYFSETYGFVKLEYELLNDLKVNMWLIDFHTGKEFNDTRTFFKTKKYIKE